MATARSKFDNYIWRALLHWGMKMWGGQKYPRLPHPKDRLQLEYPVWRDITQQMSDIGMNMVIVDVGEGIEYKAHPELAVKGTWTQAKFKDEVNRLKDLGLEPVPKLNFSAIHDDWLGEYSLMLCTPEYYRVCSDCINEMIDLFEGPRYFHIGMDEEANAYNQKLNELIVSRRGKVWWHDWNFFVDLIEKRGARAIAWVPSEDGEDPSEWISNARKSVVMNTGGYGRTWNLDDADVGYIKQGYQAIEKLNALGYDQLVCGTTWVPGYYKDRHVIGNDVNFPLNVIRAKERISKEHLLGFMMAPWEVTDEKRREFLKHSIDIVAQSMKV